MATLRTHCLEIPVQPAQIAATVAAPPASPAPPFLSGILNAAVMAAVVVQPSVAGRDQLRVEVRVRNVVPVPAWERSVSRYWL